MINFQCKFCNQNLTVKDEFENKSVKCPKCKFVSIAIKPIHNSFENPFEQAEKTREKLPATYQNLESVNAGKKSWSYVESNLVENEEIIYKGKQHIMFFFMPIVTFLICMPLCLLVSFAGFQKESIGIGLLGMLLCLLPISLVFSAIMSFVSSEFVVTNKRVIMKTGFFSQKIIELVHNKIDSLSINQGLLGRMFDYGTVIVGVAVERQEFDFIENPLEFRRNVQTQMKL